MGEVIQLHGETDIRKKLGEFVEDVTVKDLTEDQLNSVMEKASEQIVSMAEQLTSMRADLEAFVKDITKKNDNLLILSVLTDYVADAIEGIHVPQGHDELDYVYSTVWKTEVKKAFEKAVKEVRG